MTRTHAYPLSHPHTHTYTYTNTHTHTDSECLRDLSKTGMDRSWRWQKCSQLAYLQAAPASGSLRSSALTLPALLEQCAYVFGEGVTPDPEAFNAKFGGATPNTTKVHSMLETCVPATRLPPHCTALHITA